MKNDKIYQAIAAAVGAYHRCIERGNEFAQNWDDYLDKLEETLPSGSGIDRGTKIDRDESGDEKITLEMGFHHMDQNGFYAGWTDHKIIVTPSFRGFHLRITGRDRNAIKEYLYDVYSHALGEPAPEMEVKREAATVEH